MQSSEGDCVERTWVEGGQLASVTRRRENDYVLVEEHYQHDESAIVTIVRQQSQIENAGLVAQSQRTFVLRHDAKGVLMIDEPDEEAIYRRPTLTPKELDQRLEGYALQRRPGARLPNP